VYKYIFKCTYKYIYSQFQRSSVPQSNASEFAPRTRFSPKTPAKRKVAPQSAYLKQAIERDSIKVFIYVFIYVYTYLYICIHINVHIYIYVYIFSYIYIYICIYVFFFPYIYICIYIYIFIYMYIFKYSGVEPGKL
jgi:hypothetical protein